ncbi:hypothetical protein SVAN01_01216 [Stagonosporopsis vannaccii]|nr:hypothetical protein SVAN01_01216 [Stagonosporopsis vannaccii]
MIEGPTRLAVDGKGDWQAGQAREADVFAEQRWTQMHRRRMRREERAVLSTLFSQAERRDWRVLRGLAIRWGEKRVKRPEGRRERWRARRKGDKRTADEGSERARLFDADWLLAGLALCRERLGSRRLAPPASVAPDTLQHWVQVLKRRQPCALVEGWSACWPAPALIAVQRSLLDCWLDAPFVLDRPEQLMRLAATPGSAVAGAEAAQWQRSGSTLPVARRTSRPPAGPALLPAVLGCQQRPQGTPSASNPTQTAPAHCSSSRAFAHRKTRSTASVWLPRSQANDRPQSATEQLLSPSKYNPCVFTETRALAHRSLWILPLQHCRQHAEACMQLLQCCSAAVLRNLDAPAPSRRIDSSVCQRMLAKVRFSTRNLQCISHSARRRQSPVLISFTRVTWDEVGSNLRQARPGTQHCLPLRVSFGHHILNNSQCRQLLAWPHGALSLSVRGAGEALLISTLQNAASSIDPTWPLKPAQALIGFAFRSPRPWHLQALLASLEHISFAQCRGAVLSPSPLPTDTLSSPEAAVVVGLDRPSHCRALPLATKVHKRSVK